MTRALVLPLSNVARDDLPIAGGKGANLGELIQGGFDVPDGFVVTTVAYDEFVGDLEVPGRSGLRAARKPAGRGAVIGHGRGPARRQLRRTAGDLPQRARHRRGT